MTEAGALRALTLTPAKLMHLESRIGSLEKGKDADFVILNGKPFSIYTQVMQTWIDGVKRFDATLETDRPYRDGGFLLPRGVAVPPMPAVAKPGFVETVPAPMAPPAEVPLKGVTVIKAARVYTGKAVLQPGVVVVRDGKIAAVGKPGEVAEPAGATVLRAAEVTPGFIDAYTTAGLSGAWNIPADQDQDETSDLNQSDLRVLDGFNPNEPLLEFLRQNGISVAHATGGRATILAGTSGVFRTDAKVADAALKPSAALLINLGESAKGGKIQTRMGVAAFIRKAFTEAENYRAKPTPVKNPKLEALIPVLEGKRPVIFAAHRADDIRTGLRIAEEFKLKPILALGSEAWMMAEELAKKKIPVIMHPTMQRPGNSMESLHTLLANAAILKAAGVTVVFSTAFEGYVPKNRNLRAEVALAAARGLGVEAAITASTIEPAKLLGIDKDHGSIEVGKIADIVLYDGDPFEYTTHVTYTLLAGKVVFDRSEYLRLPLERRIIALINEGAAGCCLGIW